LDGRLSVLANRLQIAIRSANRALAVRAQDNAALDGSGATVAAVLFGNDDVAISHVGDCRVYLLRNGVLTQMTRDHSIVAEQIAMGLIEPEAARTHPLRHVVTRAVSGQAGMTVDTLELKVEPGDRLLLCSDGIHGVLTDKEIAEIVADRQCPLEEVCRAAIDRVNTRGGPDNSTAVLVEAS
jgi:protein phosphatase